jgi:integrase/recombinase XerC
LSDVEVTLCRASSRLGEAGGRSLHRAVCWALGETTAVTSEISAIRVGDVDNRQSPRWVRLPGTRRHDPRLGELGGWGSPIVARQLELLTQRRCTPGPC